METDILDTPTGREPQDGIMFRWNTDMLPGFPAGWQTLTRLSGRFLCFGGELRWFRPREPLIRSSPDQHIP